ncbi:MAG: hypothetical protein R2844_05575 [Caldilineales bacterium]
MTTTTLSSTAQTYGRVREAAGPRGNLVLGNTWQLQHDPLAFLMQAAAEYGDVARYRLGNVTFHQINHPTVCSASCRTTATTTSRAICLTLFAWWAAMACSPAKATSGCASGG